MADTSGEILDFRPGMAMRWEITHTGATTAGQRFEALNWIEPGLAAPPIHMHPNAEETYEVVEGALEVFTDGSWRRLGPGETATVPPGAPHSLRNASSETTKIRNVHAPAQQHEAFFRDMHRLLDGGKIKQLPPKDPRSAIHVAMLFRKYPDEIRVVKPPNALFAVLATVGTLLRFKL